MREKRLIKKPISNDFIRYIDCRINLRVLITILIISFSILGSHAQRSQEIFGKNRIQYKKFDWKSIETKNFIVYYYSGGNSIAHNTARFAEENFENVAGLVGYHPYQKSSLIVYNSVSDLQQSNINLKGKAFVGGKTDLVKSKIELAFSGNLVDYKIQVRSKIAELLINVMMYGGGFREALENSYLLHLPEWVSRGAASFAGSSWDPEIGDAMKDLMEKKKFDPGVLTGEHARLIGHALFYYISVQYGEEYIANVINLTKVMRNPSQSISYSLGVSYETFLKDCLSFYRRLLDNSNLGQEVAEKSFRIRKGNKKGFTYSGLALNPYQGKVAYTDNLKGKYRVYVVDTLTGKKKKVLRGGFKMVDQKIDYTIPILGWRNVNELSMISYKKGRPYLVTKNFETGKREKKLFNAFDGIISVDYSPVANEMVLCAIDRGHSDIFVYDFKKNKARQITKDLYDDRDPKYIPGTNTIVFSSNRFNDTLRKDFGSHDDINNQYDLFMYDVNDLNRKKPYLKRLTHTKYNETNPVPISENQIVYRAEVNRNIHLYSLKLDEQYANQVSNFYKNIKLFDINSSGGLSFVQTTKGKEFIYFISDFSLDSNYVSYEVLPEEQVSAVEEKLTDIEMLHELVELDFSKYNFVGDSLKMASSLTNSLNKNGKKPLRISNPYDYKNMLGVNYTATTAIVDPLRGFGIVADASMSEMFNNHRLSASIFILSDFKSSSFRVEYEYLPLRNDFKLVYDKYSIFAFNEVAVHRYNRHTFEAQVSRPLTPATRVSLIPQFMQTRFTDFDFSRVEEPDEVVNYAGLRAEIVVDNTIEHDLNQLQGTRLKFSISNHQNFGEGKLDFGKIIFDVRHYQRLIRSLTFAMRGSYGQFFGSSPKKFLIGGMDNWLFANTDNSNGEDPLELEFATPNNDILFVEYATSLRGFNYNKLAGPKFALANFELRLPIARFFTNKPISSYFIQHLQFIGFYDVGTTWKGSSPFNKENDVNTKVIENSSFSATVVNFRNPFLQGFGFGLRSMLGGYYMKFDVAWGIENYNTLPAKAYLTLGYDF